MNDVALGRVFRRLRLRLGIPQVEVAARAAMSDSTYSLLERGHLDRFTLAAIRRVAAVLEVDLVLEPRWRGGALDRLISSRHAGMTEAVARLLVAASWEVRPEVSFSIYGERGVIDLVGWHPSSQAMLLVELKTEIVDVNDLLAVSSRRRRLAPVIARDLGWQPVSYGQWLVVALSRTNERRVAAHRTAIRAAFPGDGRSMASWMRAPRHEIAALSFLAAGPPDSGPTGRRRTFAPTLRVRRKPPRSSSRGTAA